MAAICKACGTRPLRRDNRSGVCEPCRRKKRSAIACAGGCGRPLDVRARHALCRQCAMALAHRIAAQLAELAGRNDPHAADLFAAAVALSRRRYSAVRAAAFTSSLLAYGAASVRASLLTEDPNARSA